MSTTSEVRRPIFIVGCGRSGTTLLYDMLCCHPALGWFSRYTNRWPAVPQLAVLNRLYPTARRHRLSSRAVPFPSEGHAIWNRVRPAADPALVGRPLGEGDLTSTETMRATEIITAHLRYHGRPRFVNKNTTNTVRMRYLRAMFADAQFVHLIRDPQPAVASFLKVDWWSELKVWCFDGCTPREWEAAGNRPETMAAHLWRQEVGLALSDSRHLPDDAYLEIRYETLVAEPHETVARILDFAELPWSATFEKLLGTFEVSDRNRTAGLPGDQVTEVNRITGDLAQRLGYPSR